MVFVDFLKRNISKIGFTKVDAKSIRQKTAAHVSLSHYSIVKEP